MVIIGWVVEHIFGNGHQDHQIIILMTFLWAAQKERIYFNRIETQDELEEQIEIAFATIQRQHIRNATGNIAYRANK